YPASLPSPPNVCGDSIAPRRPVGARRRYPVPADDRGRRPRRSTRATAAPGPRQAARGGRTSRADPGEAVTRAAARRGREGLHREAVRAIHAAHRAAPLARDEAAAPAATRPATSRPCWWSAAWVLPRCCWWWWHWC